MYNILCLCPQTNRHAQYGYLDSRFKLQKLVCHRRIDIKLVWGGTTCLYILMNQPCGVIVIVHNSIITFLWP